MRKDAVASADRKDALARGEKDQTAPLTNVEAAAPGTAGAGSMKA